jgi:hypothetical protein
MDKGTVRTSTILIATRETTGLFDSIDEVPADLRRRLEEAVNGDNSAVLLIADRSGRQRISDILRQANQPAAPEPTQFNWRLAVELGLCGGSALLIWLLIALR